MSTIYLLALTLYRVQDEAPLINRTHSEMIAREKNQGSKIQDSRQKVSRRKTPWDLSGGSLFK